MTVYPLVITITDNNNKTTTDKVVAFIPSGFSEEFATALAKAACAIVWTRLKLKGEGYFTKWRYGAAVNITIG